MVMDILLSFVEKCNNLLSSKICFGKLCSLTFLVLSTMEILPLRKCEIHWHSMRLNNQTNITNTSNRSVDWLYPPPWRLLNIRMSYLVNNDVCGFSADIVVIILITSHCGNSVLRQNIRDAFPSTEMYAMNIRRLFLLARIDPGGQDVRKYPKVDPIALKQENQEHGDLVIGDFLEDYRNLTYKHLMGLQWAGRFCAQAKYIIKQDDDIMVDYYQIANILKYSNEWKNKLASGKVIIGKKLQNSPVVRNQSSKWFVRKLEFESDVYPDFVSGWAYITTVKVAKALVIEAPYHPFFWIDDVFVTGVLRNEISVEILDISETFTPNKEYLDCCLEHESNLIQPRRSNNFWCDYIIGPSNTDVEFMKEFLKKSKTCFVRTCKRRAKDKNLNTTCVKVTKPNYEARPVKYEIVRLKSNF